MYYTERREFTRRVELRWYLDAVWMICLMRLDAIAVSDDDNYEEALNTYEWVH